MTEKKIAKLEGKDSNNPVSDGLDFNAVPQSTSEIVFTPNEGPQTEFLAASEREVLYGGAAGGGKSQALLADPLRYFNNPAFVGLLLRRTNDELRELVWKSKELYPKAYQERNFRRRRANGSSQAEQDYG